VNSKSNDSSFYKKIQSQRKEVDYIIDPNSKVKQFIDKKEKKKKKDLQDQFEQTTYEKYLYLLDKNNAKTKAEIDEGQREIRKKIRMDKLLMDVYGHTDKMMGTVDNFGETWKQTKKQLQNQSESRKQKLL